MTEPALLIIDVQRAFVNEHTGHVGPLAEELQNRYKTVYASRFVLQPDSLFAVDLKITADKAAPGTGQEQFAFVPAPHVRLYSKTGYSSADTRLLGELQTQGITEVHLCGMDTDACVMATALALFNANVRPVVLAYACASSGGPEHHADALRLLSRNIGEDQVRREDARRRNT